MDALTEIKVSRKSAWNIIKKRHHRIVKVYTSGSEKMDLLLLGDVSVELSNEKSLTSPFAARVVIVSTNKSDPRIQFYQAIVVSLAKRATGRWHVN